MPGHVVTVGETMGLVRATAIGSLEHVSDLALHVGGAESNVAIGVVRLGGRATWIGRVGDDSLGRRILRELRGEQVDVGAIVDGGARTGLMLKETPTAGTTRVLYYRAGSAGSRLSSGDLDAETIRTADLLHVTGITLALSESAAAAVHDAVGIARSAGVTVSFDVNHRASLWADRDAAEAYRELARQADIVFAGDGEAELLVGSGEPAELAEGIAALGATQAVVKLGERGCIASIDGSVFSAPAEQITVVDSVGAGDAFVAGYVTALLDGADPLARLQQANRCGAFACLGPGDWESLPRRADLAGTPGADPVIR